MIRAAQDCHSMAELRDSIDHLDRELVHLLAQRAKYIDRAIELKPAEGLPARIPDRVEAVVQNVIETAKSDGLDSALAEHLWRQLIDWSIDREALKIDLV
ncbi:MAG: chorismate mutase [Pseudoruegeria sp.]